MFSTTDQAARGRPDDGRVSDVALAVVAEAAERNLAAAVATSPWLQTIPAQAAVIGSSPASTVAKYRRFVILAERVSQAVKPHSACRRDCNHCCHIAVAVSEFEARQIGKAIGREVIVPADLDGTGAGVVDKYKGVPCPFLADGACSIYAHRPVACRVHFNLADDESMCSLEVPSQESAVPNLNLGAFWLSNAWAFGVHKQGDIRDFFGAGR